MKIDIEVAKKMRAAGKTYREIAAEFSATPSAVYQLLTAAEPKKGEPDYEAMVSTLKEKYDPKNEIEEIDYDEIEGSNVDHDLPEKKKKKTQSKANTVCCPACDNELDERDICHNCGVAWR